MSWAQRLFRLAVGGQSDLPEAVATLPSLLVAGAESLTRCAELAPGHAFEDELRQLAEQERSMADRLRTALQEVGVKPSTDPAGVPASVGENNWARLVQTLEQHRTLRAQLLETAMIVADVHAKLGATLEQLSRDVHGITERVRDLVARTDPQALD